MEFSTCPNCRAANDGFDVMQCRHCGGMWCFKSRLFGQDGCGTDGTACQHCRRTLRVPLVGRSDIRIMGRINA